MKSTRPVKAKSKSPVDSAALEVLREFVEDVKAAHGNGRGYKIDAEALDWPDLAATYDKAVVIVKGATGAADSSNSRRRPRRQK